MLVHTSLNLTAEELVKMMQWMNGLREEEQKRVAAVVKSIYFTDWNFSGQLSLFKHPADPVAIIAAGSSVGIYLGQEYVAPGGYHETYKDINLFVVPQRPIITGHNKYSHPKRIAEHLVRTLEGKLPEHCVIKLYDGIEGVVEDTVLYDSRRPHEPNVVDMDAPVVLSVFGYYDRFNTQRKEYPEDLVNPYRYAGAEQIIAFNKKEDARYIVINRQYPVPKRIHSRLAERGT